MRSQFDPHADTNSEHQTRNVPTVSAHTTSATDAPVLAAETLRERFLDRLATQMRDGVSAEAQADMREEIRSHLIVSASAFEELGMLPEEAMRAAIARFGKAEQIGSNLRREQSSYRNTLKRRLMCGVFSMGAGGIISAPLFALADYAMVTSGLVHYSSGAAIYALGGIWGAFIGRTVTKRQLKMLPAMLCGIKCNWLFILAIACLNTLPNHQWPIRSAHDIPFISLQLLLFGTAGMVTGAATSMASRLLPRLLPDIPEKPASTS